jgi:hypothetical protein
VFITTADGLLYGELCPDAAEITSVSLRGRDLQAACAAAGIASGGLNADGRRWQLFNKRSQTDRRLLPNMLTVQQLRRDLRERFGVQPSENASRENLVSELNDCLGIVPQDVEVARELMAEAKDEEGRLKSIPIVELSDFKQLAVAASHNEAAFRVFVLCVHKRSGTSHCALIELTRSRGLQVSEVKFAKLPCGEWHAISARPDDDFRSQTAVICGSTLLEIRFNSGEVVDLWPEGLGRYVPIVGVASAPNRVLYFVSRQSLCSWVCKAEGGVVEVLIGRDVQGEPQDGGPIYGTVTNQASRLAVIGTAVAVADEHQIRRISKTSELADFLKRLLDCGAAFGMKLRDEEKRGKTGELKAAAKAIGGLYDFISSCNKQALVELYPQNPKRKKTSGADGTFSNITMHIMQLLLEGIS